MLHLQKIARRPLKVLAGLMAMSRSIEKRSQVEHVTCLGEGLGVVAVSASSEKTALPQSRDKGGCSTIACQGCPETMDSQMITSGPGTLCSQGALSAWVIFRPDLGNN